MITTPSLGLKVWNLTTDPYAHDQLADNWAKVDQHDHTPGKGLPITTSAIADGSITTSKLGTGITATPTDSSVTMAKLASDVTANYEPAFSTYKDINGTERVGQVTASTTVGTYIVPPTAPGSLGGVAAAGGANTGGYEFYFDPADYTANTRTNKLRVRAQLVTNAVAPTATFTVGLYSVATFGGASGAIPIVATLGAVVAGSTVGFTTPGASNGGAQGNSGDFVFPAAGFYVLAVATTVATTAVNSVETIRGILQVRQV